MDIDEGQGKEHFNFNFVVKIAKAYYLQQMRAENFGNALKPHSLSLLRKVRFVLVLRGGFAIRE